MNLALVLSGGAARGAFHLGVLAFFDEHNIKFEAYSGSSIGALIATSYASGISPKEQLKIFKSKEIKKAIKFNPFLNGLFKIDEQNPIIKELLPIENLEDIKKAVFVCVYDYKNKQLIYYPKGNTLTICTASLSLFPLFKATNYDNRKLIDGGIVDNLPVRPLLNKNLKICSIDLFPKTTQAKEKEFNPIKTLKRRAFKTWKKNLEYSIAHSDIYITNERLRKYKIFTFENLDELFNLGYKEASNYLSSFE